MEALTRELVEAQMMSLIDVYSEAGRWDWTLSEIGAGIARARPSNDHDGARFGTREGAVLNAFRWIESNAPELQKAAAKEAAHGVRHRNAAS